MSAALRRLNDPEQTSVWISTVDPERAMAAAEALDRRRDQIDSLPLYGAIFSVKDNIDVAGESTTAACPDYRYVAERSAPVVEAAIAAGALYLGKTNLDQFATGLVGVRSPYGVPRNPHNPAFIPGGSSSGAGVSVSTGIAQFAFGSDTGGSGRVPACYNGVVGLKPAPGALSRRGMVYACRSFDTATIFAADAADAAAVFRAVAGPDPLDPYSQVPPQAPEIEAGFAGLRLGRPRDEQLKFFGDPETESLYRQALEAAAALGAEIVEFDFAPFDAVGDLMFFGPLLAERDAAVGGFIERSPEACDPVVRDLILGSRRFSAADAYRALYRIAEARVGLGALWARADALMLPTVGRLYRLAEVESDPLTPNFNNGYYTNAANPLGLAAVARPFGAVAAGVPYGVTFLAPAGHELRLCALAERFGAAAP